MSLYIITSRDLIELYLFDCFCFLIHVLTVGTVVQWKKSLKLNEIVNVLIFTFSVRRLREDCGKTFVKFTVILSHPRLATGFYFHSGEDMKEVRIYISNGGK